MKKISLKDKFINCDPLFFSLLAFLLISVLMSLTIYSSSLERLFEALQDICTSVASWFLFVNEIPLGWILDELPTVDATILSVPIISFEDILNVDFAGLSARLERLPEALRTSFGAYNSFLFDIFYWVFLIGANSFLLPFLLGFIFVRLFFSSNNRPNGYISIPARIYIWILRNALGGAKRTAVSFFRYMKDHKGLTYLIWFVWLINLNVITISLEAFAAFYYFLAGFNFNVILPYLATLGLDLLVLILYMPLPFWFVIVARIYYRYCEYLGIDRLNHMEAKNCGFIKTLDITTLITGEPGAGKTTALVAIVQSLINIFKKDDEKVMYKYELYFPAFPFAAFREDILKRIESHEFWCFPNVEDYVDDIVDVYEKTGEKEALYGYEGDLFAKSVDVGNRDISLSQALKEYGKAFFEYNNENMVIANFPIRLDGNFDDSDRLKLWNGNYFERKKNSFFCHILNQDMLRHGVKVDSNSKEIGMLGPSIIGWTEISKDLGNQNTNAHLKADSLTSNAKNEKSIYSFMLARHAKTMIDFDPHIRFVSDDQRASNVMAAAVGLMSVLHVNGRSETMIAIPGFDFVFIARDHIVKPCQKLFLKRENARGDITLSSLLIKQLLGYMRLSADRLTNRFGYEEMYVTRQQGSAFSSNTGVVNSTGAAEERTMYIHYMKVYSDRFPSDIFAEAYATAQKKAGAGIRDIPTYKALYPGLDELEYQRSRLTSDVIQGITGVDIMKK